MKQLYAFYESKRVGVLTKDDEEVYSFEYERTWREDPNAFPISLSMPLDQGKFGNKVTLSFFENLLPEGDVRKELEAAHKINGVFDFLAEFGRDCGEYVSELTAGMQGIWLTPYAAHAREAYLIAPGIKCEV